MPAEVQALRALADAATPEPYPYGVRPVADAAFFAVARVRVPALCDKVERLCDQIDAAAGMIVNRDREAERLTRELAAMTAERDSARAALAHAEAMKRNCGQK